MTHELYFRDSDRNDDGMLDRAEVYRTYNNLVKMGRTALSREEYDELRFFSFDDIDVDNNEYLSESELSNAFEELLDKCEEYKKQN